MSLPTSDQGRAFLSYNWADREAVDAICVELRRYNISFWIDQDGIKAGDDIVEKLNGALADCKVFIAFVGPHYFRSGSYTSAEYGAAFHKARSAASWRMIVVKLAPEVELPPLAAGRLCLVSWTPAQTAHDIARALEETDAWDSPVESTPRRVDIQQIGDFDLELVVSSYVRVVPALARSSGVFVTHEVTLPRRRTLELTILREVVQSESITLTLGYLLERVETNRRFVLGFSRQIDDGFLGRFEVSAQIALERAQSRLSEATKELRTQLQGIVEEAVLEVETR